MLVGSKLSKEDDDYGDGEDKKKMVGVSYRAIIGSLMYLMVSTRPDLAAAVGILSRFLENPLKSHWSAVKHLLRYIQGTKQHGLLFRKKGKEQNLELRGFNHGWSTVGEALEVQGFSDADWAGCIDTRRSTTGYVFLLGGAAISWSSTRQQTVALSSTEAEYMAATSATQEAIWQRDFLQELGIMQQEASQVWTDNQSALKLMHNPLHRKQVKHVNLRFFFLREQIEKGVVKFSFLGTEEQVADSLTKAVSIQKTEFCRHSMGVINLASI
jgi:hypothetical protein